MDAAIFLSRGPRQRRRSGGRVDVFRPQRDSHRRGRPRDRADEPRTPGTNK